MSLAVRCPDCSTRLNAPDSAAGKAVKCPRCGSRVPVPAAGPEDADEARPEEAIAARPKPRPAAAAPRPRRDEPEEDEDEDDRPRPRRGQAEAGGNKVLVLALLGVGGLVLLGAAGGGVWWLTRAKPTTASTGPGPSASTKDTGKEQPKGTGPGDRGTAPTKPEAAAKVLAPAARFPVSFAEVTAVRLNADGTRAAIANSSLSGKAAFQVWDLKPEPKKVRELPGLLLAVSPGLERAVRKGDGGAIEVVDLENGSVVAKLPAIGGLAEYHFRSPTSVVILKRGNKEEDGDRAGRLIVREFDVAAARAADLFDVAADNSARAALVKDGRELFVGWPKTGRVEVWDLTDRKMARDFNLAGLKTGDNWGAFVVSPDGKWVAADASGGEALQVFDASTGAAVGPTGSAQLFPAFVPGRNVLLGRTTVVIDLKGTVRNGFWAYDVDKRTITACLQGTYSGLAFSGDGRTAANWELFKQTEVVIWDLGQLP